MSSYYRSEAGRAEVEARYREYLQRWPLANEQRFLTTSLGQTHVLSCGPAEAPAVVLLHGAMGNAAAWQFDARVWARQLRLHIVDVVGDAGLSASVRPAFTGDTYAQWLGEVIAGLGLRRTALVGESMGGWLALDFATRHPERVTAIALLCPAGVGTQRNFLAKVWPLLLLGPWGARKIRQLALGPLQGTPTAEQQAFMAFLALVFSHLRPRHVRFPLFSDEQLQRLRMPLLWIAGARDVFFDNIEAERRLRANCPQARLELRPNAGHLLQQRTQPVLDFLLSARLGGS